MNGQTGAVRVADADIHDEVPIMMASYMAAVEELLQGVRDPNGTGLPVHRSPCL